MSLYKGETVSNCATGASGALWEWRDVLRQHRRINTEPRKTRELVVTGKSGRRSHGIGWEESARKE
ncbi:hypothetical protein QQZ08_001679 [Neonectria magnoliae]|uniref:Uncharacterized protein n=1 Tax=Neonectria magnoliae TaxID=2732573 RepID=A0ABR1IDP6_9HYPO